MWFRRAAKRCRCTRAQWSADADSGLPLVGGRGEVGEAAADLMEEDDDDDERDDGGGDVGAEHPPLDVAWISQSMCRLKALRQRIQRANKSNMSADSPGSRMVAMAVLVAADGVPLPFTAGDDEAR